MMRVINSSKSALIWLIVIAFALLVTTASYSAVLDPKTVEVAYLFDEGKANTVKDISGNGRDGDLSGAKYTKGVFGTCLDYDGKDDNLVVPGYAGIGGTDPRTTVFWFKAGDTREHSWVKWGPESYRRKVLRPGTHKRRGVQLES